MCQLLVLPPSAPMQRHIVVLRANISHIRSSFIHQPNLRDNARKKKGNLEREADNYGEKGEKRED